MKSYDTRKSKTLYLYEKRKLLEEFGIRITPEILDRLSSLYPNDIATENYTRKVILDHLKD